jgi:hypothetical protein
VRQASGTDQLVHPALQRAESTAQRDNLSELLSVEKVRWFIRAQKLRPHYLGDRLFGDPSWELLLELLLASVENRPMQVSGLGISAGIPTATAHRWLDRLTSRGLVARRADDADRRRIFVEPTELAIRQVMAYVADLSGCSGFGGVGPGGADRHVQNSQCGVDPRG